MDEPKPVPPRPVVLDYWPVEPTVPSDVPEPVSILAALVFLGLWLAAGLLLLTFLAAIVAPVFSK
jgi:hypothetical protein